MENNDGVYAININRKQYIVKYFGIMILFILFKFMNLTPMNYVLLFGVVCLEGDYLFAMCALMGYLISPYIDI
jgi:hypothetical protein